MVKNKKKIPIGLVLCLAIVLVCGGITVAALVTGKFSLKKEVVMEAKMNVEEADTLRELLVQDGTCEITVTKDITVKEELIVNGNKTLKGKGSIIMDLSNIGQNDSVLAVESDATLVLDGAILDGNGVANGLTVKSGGNFTALSGKLIYGYPYGMQVAGTAKVENIIVEKALHTSIYVDLGGKLDMQGGELNNAAIAHLATAGGSQTSLSGDVKIHDSHGYLIYNYGKMDITGGTYHGSHETALANYGEMNITGTEQKPIEVYDSDSVGIYHVKGTRFDMNHVYVHDTAKQGIMAEKKSTGSIQNTVLKHNGKSALYVNNSVVTCKNITISDGETYGFYAQNKAQVDVENLTVRDMKQRGVANSDATIIGKNITVENTGQTGFFSGGENPTSKIENVTLVKSGTSALGITGGKTTATNVTIEESTKEGLYVGEKANADVTDITIKKSGTIGAYVGKDAVANITNISIQNAGTHGVADRGGKLTMKNVKISGSKDCAMTLRQGSDVVVKEATVTDTGLQAVYMNDKSKATIHNMTINKTGKAAVVVSNSTLSLKTADIKGAATYGVYAEKGPKDAGCGVFADNVTIHAPGERGFGNLASYMVITNSKVFDSKGAGVYATGKAAITNMNQIELTNPGASGFGFVGGEVTGRNLTVTNSKNEGVYVGKDANVKQLDNVTVVKPGTHGVGLYGGKLNITADTKYNPENKKGNGITITSPGKRGMHIDGGKVTATSVTIKDTPQQGIAIDKEANVRINQCKIYNTKQAAVRMSNSTLTLKNATIETPQSYGVYVEKSTKDAGKVANLENVTITKPGDRGIGNIGSYVVMKDVTVTESKGAGIYASGEDSITNMNQIVLTKPGASGLGLTAGTATARNVTVTNSKGEGVHVGEKANVKIDNVTVTDSGNHGVINYGTLNITADTKFNPENKTGNGITITNPSGSGVVLFTGKVTAQGVTIQDTNAQDMVLKNGIVLKESTEFTGNGVTIKNTSEYGISVPAGATATLSDTTIEKTATGKDAINTSGTLNITSKVSIKDSGSHGIYVGGGKVTANGVTIKDTEKTGINMQGKSDVKVSNLSVSDTKAQGIYVAKDGTKAEITGFDVKNTGSAAVRIMNKTKVALTDGTVASKSYGMYVSNTSETTATNVKVERMESNANTLVVVADTAKLTMVNNTNGESVIDGKKATSEKEGFTGRGVEVQGTFTMNGGNIVNHQITADTNGAVIKANKSDGAAVYVVAGGTFTMNGGTIKDNQAKNAGGAVAINGEGATFNLVGGTISDNKAAYGAVMARVGAFNMNGGKITANTATTSGGGVTVSKGTFVMKKGEISNNTASIGGGVFMNSTGTITLEGGEVKNNKATTSTNQAGGGGICITAGTCMVKGVARISENTSTKDGGGVSVLGGTFELQGGTISDNTATAAGGGISVNKDVTSKAATKPNTAEVTISGGTISGNKAQNGAGIILREYKSISMTGGVIELNEAKENGGGIYLGKGTFEMTGGTIQNNKALGTAQGGKGGGIYLPGGQTVKLTSGTITGNTKKGNAVSDVEAVTDKKGTLTIAEGFNIGQAKGTFIVGLVEDKR